MKLPKWFKRPTWLKKPTWLKMPVKLNMSNDGKAALFTLAFVYLFIIAEIIYKVKIERKTCTMEIILLFLIFSVFGIFKKLFSKAVLPTDLNGNPLPHGYSKEEKKVRSIAYRKSALIYSLVFAFINTVAFSCNSAINNVNVAEELFFENGFPSFLFAIIVSAVFTPIVFLFAYIIESLWYEYKISLYNEMLERKKQEQELLKALIEKQRKTEQKPAPKKRGRPPKEKQEPVADTIPKKRGRPPKKKQENENA